MRYLLNLVYALLILAVSPRLVYAAVRQGKYRQGWREKLLGNVPFRDGVSPCVWLHAVSVGEMNMLAGLIQRLGKFRPDTDVVISTTTRAAHEMARRKYPQHTLFYCPLDFSWAVERTLRRIRPDLLVLVELELWPNLLAAANRHEVPVTIVNGRISDRSFRQYLFARPFTRRWLAKLSWLGAQSEADAQRFLALGAEVDRLDVTGSLKFDGVQSDRNNSKTKSLANLAGIGPDDLIFLAGSTQAPEEALALRVFSQLAQQHANLRLVLVPRHPERFEAVALLIAQSGLRYERRSQWKKSEFDRMPGTDNPSPSSQSHDRRWQVLLVDTVGELGAWWGTAEIAFVGGSFGNRGGQNMLEPAAYGAAVAFGPNTQNFRDITRLLLAADGAARLPDEDALQGFVERCAINRDYRVRLGENARRLVDANRGATDRTTAQLLKLLPTQQKSDIRVDASHPVLGGGFHAEPSRNSPNIHAEDSHRR